MTTDSFGEDTITTLIAETYPNLSKAERREVRLDLELMARWLLNQVELDTPALEQAESYPDNR